MFTTLADIPYRFYVFSERLGNNEGREYEKILYAYPSSRSVDDQLKDVGLSEAILRFYNTFAPLGHYRVLRTADGRMALHSPEPGIWLCLSIKFPSVRPEGAERSSSAVVQTGFVSDGVLQTILSTFYQLWHLHYENVSTIINNASVIDCRYHLKNFFDRLLVESQSFSWNLIDTFSGVSFLPLERISYLKIHSFLNRLECTFSQISSTLFFCSHFLTWSGVNQEDTRTLYFYATRFLGPMITSGEGSDRAKSFSSGRFLQPIFTDGGPHHIVIRAHLSTYPDQTVSLLAYKILSVTIFIVVPNEDDVNDQFLHDLSDFFSEHLLMVASDLAKAITPITSSSLRDESIFKFIYYNTSNSALKSTINDERTRLIDKSVVPVEAVSRMMMLSDYLAPLEPIEVATSVSNDTWIVVKKTAQRQLFLVVTRQRGTCTLIHVADEIRKLSASTFSDILFLEI